MSIIVFILVLVVGAYKCTVRHIVHLENNYERALQQSFQELI